MAMTDLDFPLWGRAPEASVTCTETLNDCLVFLIKMMVMIAVIVVAFIYCVCVCVCVHVCKGCLLSFMDVALTTSHSPLLVVSFSWGFSLVVIRKLHIGATTYCQQHKTRILPLCKDISVVSEQ